MGRNKLYNEITNYLKSAIQNGNLKVGEAIYSEPELCKKFNVSRTPVRNAIRQLAAENILVSRQGQGTYVKGDGHGLIHNAICMVNHWTRKLRYDQTDTYYMDTIFGIEEECNQRQINFQMFSGVISSKDELLKQMKDRKLDGIILDGSYQTHEDDIKIFKSLTPHIVVLDGNPAETDLPCIAPDETGAFEKILELAAMHKNICFLHETMSAMGRRKLTAFKKAAKKYPSMKVIYADYSENTGYETFFNINHYPLTYKALENVFAGNTHADCIICDSDYTGVKSIKFLEIKNLRVPADVSVFGFGNIKFSLMSKPTLTTIRIDTAGMGRKSIEFLCDIIEGNANDKARFYPGSLIKRDSHK
ncbi:MAG: Transcriptional regulator, GntR family with LacI sensor [Candidatus Uhrbacteria bacterium GW2011_GWF2_39_13]|uniref:Transcriptional regulator, GntR family with LacI sensor n=1 Tax=Candidatus Uhrbacteria bacterium GW2011_GWF2_39_13 TaxID=1618995 RepID=A0A0G0QNE7_9BACT|nr:MAG: Transcriptional regulator, GntR family with LacI sensor [Candidatus Uhrbacteria bacterium GW2011_GWF2_39_13]